MKAGLWAFLKISHLSHPLTDYHFNFEHQPRTAHQTFLTRFCSHGIYVSVQITTYKPRTPFAITSCNKKNILQLTSYLHLLISGIFVHSCFLTDKHA